MAVVNRVFPVIRDTIENALNVIKGIVNVVMGILTGDWQRAWDGVKAIFSGVWAQIKNLLGLALDGLVLLVRGFVGKLGDAARAVGNAILDGISGPLEKVKDAFIWVRDKGGQAIAAAAAVAEKPLDALKKAFEAIATAVGKVRDGIKWLIDKIPSIPKMPDINIPFIGDPRNPNMTLPTSGTFNGNLMGANAEMAPFAAGAAAFGLRVTSGLRPGAITANGTPSDHGIGKALDVAGSPAGMAAFFRSLVGSRFVKQAFYDPLGSIFGGALSSYREGGHSDHVHVATYDQGGYLKPGWNLAYNGTGRPEPVGHGLGATTINFPNYVGSKQELVEWLRGALIDIGRRNGGGALGGYA
jgi:hypothetical protein